MENWKPIVGYEGLYEVSDLGNIHRIAPWCDGRKTSPKPFRLLKLSDNGYYRVTLHNNRAKREFAVHRLVYVSFIGPLAPDHQINHKNGKKTDNRPDNLEAVTPSQNQYHSYRILGNLGHQGSKHPLSKVKEQDVIEMRKLRSSGFTLQGIAELYGLSRTTVCWIVKRKSWTHI